MPLSRLSRWTVSDDLLAGPWDPAWRWARPARCTRARMAMTPAMATRCFCPPESRWGACWRVIVHAHRRQCLVHPTADLLRAPRPDSPGQRPHLPPPHWPRSGYPGSGTPCPPCAGYPAGPFLVGGVHAVHIHLAAAGQQDGVKMLGQGGLATAVVAQHRHEAPRFNVQRDAVQDQREPRLQHRCRQSLRFPL